MHCAHYIEIQPEIRSGKPCFEWNQITVYDVPESMPHAMG